MRGEQFREFLRRRYVSIFWLGHAKYQATTAYAFAPMWDYTEAQQERIRTTGMLGCWSGLIPRSEEARLLRKFAESAGSPAGGRLDLIVLTNDDSTASLSPDGREYEPTYQNASFRVWRRRPSVVPFN
jgi:hypothetical protein